MGGLSKFIQYTPDNYSEYAGVPAKVIDTENFTKETLNAIRSLIDKAGRARPRERAKYLLTEAKLMTILEPNEEHSLRSTLSKYCNAMALNHISENSSRDVIRNYYIEAFSLEENYDANVRQVSYYLLSFKAQYNALSSPNISIDDALKNTLEDNYRDNIWEGILLMFLWNRNIFSQLTLNFFNNERYKEQSIQYLKEIGIPIKADILEEYRNTWNQAREKRQRDYNRWLASIKAIYSNGNLEILSNQLSDSLHEARKTRITPIDSYRLNTIATNIVEELNKYLKQSNYKDKERSYNFAKAQINQIIADSSSQCDKTIAKMRKRF